MKAILDKPVKLLTAFALAIGLGTSAMAQDNTATTDNVTEASIQVEEFASLNIEQAASESLGQILLHFGEGFDTEIRDGIVLALEDLDYDFEIAAGGPAGMMDLFIDGNQGKRPFTPEQAVTYLLSVLEQNAAQFRVAQADIDLPTNEAG